jgi:hypothetical protein
MTFWILSVGPPAQSACAIRVTRMLSSSDIANCSYRLPDPSKFDMTLAPLLLSPIRAPHVFRRAAR